MLGWGSWGPSQNKATGLFIVSRSYPVSVLFRIAPLSPILPRGRGEGTRRWKAGAAPSGPQGSVLYVGPRKESGSWAVVEQSRCTSEPGVSTKCWQGEEQYRKGLCKNGMVSSSDSACKRCVLRTCGWGALACGHMPAGPALPRSSSLCLLFGAVFFSLPGEPKHWLLGFRPQVVDVLGRLAAPSQGRGTPWKVHGRVGGGLLDAGICGGPGCESCLVGGSKLHRGYLGWHLFLHSPLELGRSRIVSELNIRVTLESL